MSLRIAHEHRLRRSAAATVTSRHAVLDLPPTLAAFRYRRNIHINLASQYRITDSGQHRRQVRQFADHDAGPGADGQWLVTEPQLDQHPALRVGKPEFPEGRLHGAQFLSRQLNIPRPSSPS